MAKFIFKLAAVLEHRKIIEQTCQRELAKHISQREYHLTQLRNMQQSISNSKQQLSDHLQGKVDLDRIGHFARFSGQSTQQAHSIVLALAALEKRIEIARQELIAATHQRKAIELLRDKQHQQFIYEQNRIENAQMDEMGAQAFYRQNSKEAIL